MFFSQKYMYRTKSSKWLLRYLIQFRIFIRKKYFHILASSSKIWPLPENFYNFIDLCFGQVFVVYFRVIFNQRHFFLLNLSFPFFSPFVFLFLSYGQFVLVTSIIRWIQLVHSLNYCRLEKENVMYKTLFNFPVN